MFFRIENEVTFDTFGSLGAAPMVGVCSHVKTSAVATPKLVKCPFFGFLCFFFNFKIGNCFFLFFGFWYWFRQKFVIENWVFGFFVFFLQMILGFEFCFLKGS